MQSFKLLHHYVSHCFTFLPTCTRTNITPDKKWSETHNILTPGRSQVTRVTEEMLEETLEGTLAPCD